MFKSLHIKISPKYLLIVVILIALLLPLQLVLAAAGVDWTPVTDAGWAARKEHGSVVFDNKIWVMGGSAGSDFRDVWNSTDGVTWTYAGEPLWQWRCCFSSVAFDNKMWVIAGYSTGTDVWSSVDGVNWVEETYWTGWPRRVEHTSVVFDDKIWVMGGYDKWVNWEVAKNPYNDVWYSSDGVTWTEATSNAPWLGRMGHTSVVFDNKMWVIGGFRADDVWQESPAGWDLVFTYFNDVWNSTDGVTWTEATPDAGWTGRHGHTSVVFDNKMWVTGVGGVGDDDIWYSRDGVTWTEATSNAPWTGKSGYTSVVFDNKMWTMGGSDQCCQFENNEVWYSSSDIYP